MQLLVPLLDNFFLHTIPNMLECYLSLHSKYIVKRISFEGYIHTFIQFDIDYVMKLHNELGSVCELNRLEHRV